MNLAHVHLILNHVPVLGIGFGILLLAVGMVRKSGDIAKASLLLFVVAALVALPTYYTGEPAEEIVEHLPSVSESAIEEHEEAAETALIGAEVLGVIALAGVLVFSRSSAVPAWFTTLSLVISLAAGGLMARTAGLGGRIHHPEIRDEAGAYLPMQENAPHPEERDDD